MNNTETDSDIENQLMVARGKGWGKRQGIWDKHVCTAIFNMDTNKDLLSRAQGTLFNVI